MKFSHDVDEASRLINSLDTNSVSSDDFYDAEEGPPVEGIYSDIIEVPDKEGSDTDCECIYIAIQNFNNYSYIQLFFNICTCTAHSL